MRILACLHDMYEFAGLVNDHGSLGTDSKIWSTDCVNKQLLEYPSLLKGRSIPVGTLRLSHFSLGSTLLPIQETMIVYGTLFTRCRLMLSVTRNLKNEVVSAHSPPGKTSDLCRLWVFLRTCGTTYVYLCDSDSCFLRLVSAGCWLMLFSVWACLAFQLMTSLVSQGGVSATQFSNERSARATTCICLTLNHAIKLCSGGLRNGSAHNL